MPLRLKSLDLHGYKTFATRTVFEFAAGITAIVGPNGAGKSNIADALRWVLGEQSYSLLRGKKTEDMIFSGSEHRPRAGMASAEIVFDNSTNWLPVDFADVAMTRRAYRDGHNDYLLNGQHVRLREMNELLAASGLSERTYTIVGQGLVDASLALKADERRRLFEEAAGVGLYRIRREEALKRLETTQRNLERVEDIMSEIEPRLKTLERQARRANEFSGAQADLKAVLREWYGFHWHRAQHELQEARDAFHAYQSRAQEARDKLEQSRSKYGESRGRVTELRSQLNTWHRELAALHTQREAASRGLAVLEERRSALEASRASLAAQQQALLNEGQLAQRRLEETGTELERARAERDEAQSRLAEARQTLQATEAGRGTIEGQLEEVREKVVGLNAQRAEAQARLDDVRSRLEFHASRLADSGRTIESAEQDMLAARTALEKANEALQGAQARLKTETASLDAARLAVADVEARRAREAEQLASLTSSHARMRAQLEVLEQAEQTFSGYAAGARFLLDASRQSRLRAHAALSTMLELPAELETPIAAALGEAVDTVLLDLDEVESALDLLESEEAGRAVLLPVNGPSAGVIDAPDDPEIVGIAATLVKAPAHLKAAIEVLLGNTLVVRSRAAARRLVGRIPPQARVVTMRGEVFRGDGLIVAGRGSATTILSRPRQKRELAATLQEAEQRLSLLTSRIDGTSKDLLLAQSELERSVSVAAEAQRELSDQQAVEQSASLELEKQTRLLDWHRSRQVEFLREREAAEAEQRRLAALLDEFEENAGRAQSEVLRLSQEMSQLSLEEARERTAYWQTRLAVTQETANSAEVRDAEHRARAAELEDQLLGLQQRLADASAALQQLENEKAQLLENEHLLHGSLEALQARVAPAEQDLEAAEREEVGLSETESVAQRSATEVERVRTQHEIEVVRRQEALESLQARIVDDFGLVSFDYADDVEGAVPLPFEGLVEQLPQVPALRPDLEDELAQRRTRLRRLGPINTEAAREYETESERYSFMSTQVQDLHQAETDLRQVIAELDELTRQEFSRTYTAVDKQFRDIFARLFGGGSARLSLTDPDNLVETGIEIDARLPGRREQGLSLLSGGERSLTAIALVFALLKVSPTPVCVMDEVDAMLDEANVGRFRDLLKELSRETQFIIITHNRNTVQAADYIYGVTMGRDSTSQIISLRLDEVSEEMLGTSRA